MKCRSEAADERASRAIVFRLLACAVSTFVATGCSAGLSAHGGLWGRPDGASPGAPANHAPRLESGRVKVTDGTKLFYTKAGGGPAVIFIHGLGGNQAVWFQQFPFFARSYTTVTISQRGFAPSTGGRRDYKPSLLVSDLVSIMNYLGIRRAHIVGQSMGGWTALGMALRHPERVRSIVLADSLAGISDDEIADAFTAMMRNARDLAQQPPRLGVHPALDSGFRRRDPALAYLYQALSMFGAPSPAKIGPQLGAFAFKHEALAQNRLPALFVVGERDRIFPVEVVKKAAAYLGNSRLEIIPEAGHSAYYERPQRWNRVVADFLADQPQA